MYEEEGLQKKVFPAAILNKIFKVVVDDDASGCVT